MDANGGAHLERALGVLKCDNTLVCSVYTNVHLCCSVLEMSGPCACARTAGRVCRVRGYACARRARPVVRPRTERGCMVRRVRACRPFPRAVFMVPQMQYNSGSPASLLLGSRTQRADCRHALSMHAHLKTAPSWSARLVARLEARQCLFDLVLLSRHRGRH